MVKSICCCSAPKCFDWWPVGQYQFRSFCLLLASSSSLRFFSISATGGLCPSKSQIHARLFPFGYEASIGKTCTEKGCFASRGWYTVIPRPA
ncbi:hypothetical protein AVEN_60533-1 [Araneus ventricosus]|uniref:Uncharacterized protein n=1 Tax=Araneus ventricosus TaxID=182803 RepID=A0A4Y2TXQ7_ARAVE|nr:hypothetical protein AVEN_60533-1 [Araneus ventricosus]